MSVPLWSPLLLTIAIYFSFYSGLESFYQIHEFSTGKNLLVQQRTIRLMYFVWNIFSCNLCTCFEAQLLLNKLKQQTVGVIKTWEFWRIDQQHHLGLDYLKKKWTLSVRPYRWVTQSQLVLNISMFQFNFSKLAQLDMCFCSHRRRGPPSKTWDDNEYKLLCTLLITILIDDVA